MYALIFEVKQGQRYRARIHLGFWEAMGADNDDIKAKLELAAFQDVLVWGAGRDRLAEGTWTGETQKVELPEQIMSAPLPIEPRRR